ncbi:MAG: phosphoribosylglycinamide synthetase C domain-containing protein, partial [Planctomycetota bacterium]
GKGVVVTHEKSVAEKTLFDFMKNPQCSVKTNKILFEEKLIGKEVSAFALCDGENFVPLGYICDYKRLQDGDLGPNTGGMGGYAPQDWPSESCKKFVNDQIFSVVLRGMQQQGTPFRGILYAGLMIHDEKISVLEFNVRFGDPEAQILLPLIETDLVPYFQKIAEGGKITSLEKIRLRKETAVHVVLTSEGYAAIDETPMRLGETISLPQTTPESPIIFFAGVQRNTSGNLVNSGGRVLGVTALGNSLESARKKVYPFIQQIHFRGVHWRKDIAQ